MKRLLPILLPLVLFGCQSGNEDSAPAETGSNTPAAAEPRAPAAPAADDPETVAYARERLQIYAPFALQADLSSLSDNQHKMIGILIDAAGIMDELYWRQVYGDRADLLDDIDDPAVRRFVEINYGPWDRLASDKPFVAGAGPKPPGSNFYPKDMTKQEFEAAKLDGKTSEYTLLRRDDQGALTVVPYHEAYADDLAHAADLLRQAAALADDPSFKHYLELRADALASDDYRPSDMAWMDMKDNRIDLVFGPIETYQDGLFGYKAAFEAFVLLKDMDWSERLSRFAQFLPALQKGLPVPDEYKQETPGSSADLNAYDALYYAGDANAGAKTIAINLPNDETVQLEKGTRRLQLKNAMRAKFDRIMMPISDVLIAQDQRAHVTFDAFFENTMFHEVAHGLGIKNTITGKGTVREALKEHASALEEGKADILGVYKITSLRGQGEMEGDIKDNYVTFLAGIFRSIRFGVGEAHGRANMIRFNFFKEHGAFVRDEATGTYRVDFDKMKEAMIALSRKVLTLQGDGDYDGVVQFVADYGQMGPQLESDLGRLKAVPVDIVFQQGRSVLGLE